MDYKKISQDVVDHVGGITNIKGATHWRQDLEERG